MPENSETTPHAEPSPTLSIRHLPKREQWVLLLQNGLAPYVLFCMLTAGPDAPLSTLFTAWCALWVCLVAAISLALRGIGPRVSFAVGSLLSLAVAAVWLQYAPSTYPILLFPLLVMVSLYRVYRYLSNAILLDENRMGFRVDSIVAVIGLLGAAIRLSGEPRLVTWACANVAAAIVLRLYAMWTTERFYWRSQSASRTAWGWIGVLCVLGALFVPTLSDYTLHATSWVLGAVVSGLVMVVPSSWHWAPERALLQKRVKQTAPGLDMLPAHAVPDHSSVVFGTLIAGVIIMILVMVVVGKIRRQHVQQASSSPSAAPVRRWIRPRRQYVITSHPIRLQVQAWLHKEEAKGNPIAGSETVREFARRAQHSMGLERGVGDAEGDLLDLYERARYGDAPDDVIPRT